MGTQTFHPSQISGSKCVLESCYRYCFRFVFENYSVILLKEGIITRMSIKTWNILVAWKNCRSNICTTHWTRLNAHKRTSCGLPLHPNINCFPMIFNSIIKSEKFNRMNSSLNGLYYAATIPFVNFEIFLWAPFVCSGILRFTISNQ
jgi:hypothetical protein